VAISWRTQVDGFDFRDGRGHAMALVYVIKNGDRTDTPWLDGQATRPAIT
jgi:hypothetical protein